MSREVLSGEERRRKWGRNGDREQGRRRSGTEDSFLDNDTALMGCRKIHKVHQSGASAAVSMEIT